jgi:mRNA interferase RelE/StbE
LKYRVIIERQAERQIRRLASDVQRRILIAALGLADDPRPFGYLKLTGSDEYRIRVGNYRIVYRIDDTNVIVSVVRAGHRSSVY